MRPRTRAGASYRSWSAITSSAVDARLFGLASRQNGKALLASVHVAKAQQSGKRGEHAALPFAKVAMMRCYPCQGIDRAVNCVLLAFLFPGRSQPVEHRFRG